MVPHISFSEIVGTLAIVFLAGVIAGIYVAYKLDGLTLWSNKKK
jgi:ABC-type antimicrobial peptide transport system permease subunit